MLIKKKKIQNLKEGKTRVGDRIKFGKSEQGRTKKVKEWSKDEGELNIDTPLRKGQLSFFKNELGIWAFTA